MTLTRSKLVALVLAVVVAAFMVTTLGVFAVAHAVTLPQEHASSIGETRRKPMTMTVETNTASASREPQAPASLSGTDPDGDVSVPVSRGTIRLFDYYLTTLGETDLADVRTLVAAEVQRQSPDNATDVLALFDRYTAYLEDLHDAHASTVDDYLAQTIALQQRHFGADADVLFGEDNALAARLLASVSSE